MSYTQMSARKAKQLAKPGVRRSPKAAKSKGVRKRKPTQRQLLNELMKHARNRELEKEKEYGKLAKIGAKQQKLRAQADKQRQAAKKKRSPDSKLEAHAINRMKYLYTSDEPDTPTGQTVVKGPRPDKPAHVAARHKMERASNRAARAAIQQLHDESPHEAAMRKAAGKIEGFNNEKLQKFKNSSRSKRSILWDMKYRNSRELMPTVAQQKVGHRGYKRSDVESARASASGRVKSGLQKLLEKTKRSKLSSAAVALEAMRSSGRKPVYHESFKIHHDKNGKPLKKPKIDHERLAALRAATEKAIYG